MYKYVFFDLDGTLTKSEFGIMAAATKALKSFGIEIPDTEILKKFIGPPLYVSFHDFYGLSEEDTLEAINIYRQYYAKEGVYQAPLYEGVREMLEKLKSAGCTLVITTSKPETMAVKVAENDGISVFFDGIIGPALDEHDPDKAILIRRAMEKLGLGSKEFSEMIMVGDRFYDIEAAKKTGIDSLGVLYGYGNREELEKAGATYFSEKVEGITDIIL